MEKIICGPLTPNNFTVIVAEDLKDKLESEGLQVSYLHTSPNPSLIQINIEAKLSELPLYSREIKNAVRKLEPTIQK